MGTLPPPAPRGPTGSSGIGQGDDHPVDSVSWDDVAGAGGFLERLSQATGLPFRLPTEAEWEYACRGKTLTRYSFGDSFEFDGFCFDGKAGLLPGERSDYMWYCGSPALLSESGSKPVALLKPNPFGLYDIHGNVFEFVRDWYDENFYQSPEATHDNPENTTVGASHKVIRGGCWGYDATYARSALRYRLPHNQPDWGTGFRVALPGT
jgi:formylglycine-generating enzyme required for sulfatase activity